MMQICTFVTLCACTIDLTHLYFYRNGKVYSVPSDTLIGIWIREKNKKIRGSENGKKTEKGRRNRPDSSGVAKI